MLTSTVQIDAYKSAEKSQFNVHRPTAPIGSSGKGSSGSTKPAQKASFKTLADLGSS